MDLGSAQETPMRKPYEMNELYVNINALSTLVCAFLLHQSGISSRKKDFSTTWPIRTDQVHNISQRVLNKMAIGLKSSAVCSVDPLLSPSPPSLGCWCSLSTRLLPRVALSSWSTKCSIANWHAVWFSRTAGSW